MSQPMPDANQCPQCGTPLPAGALAGLCPACLLQAGAAADTVTEGRQPGFIPPSVAELAPKFPQLEILELIGKGGMGAVYKARQRELDRFLALKILPPGIGDDPAFAGRFAREAKALAKLNHPGIVTIYDFGRTDGLFYFFMEFVDGVNLRQLLHAGRVSAREALAIVPQICDALQFAHDQGIVHRDIKPENILLDRRGRVKVADFGLAKIVGLERGSVSGSLEMGQGAMGDSKGSNAGEIAAAHRPASPDLTDAGSVMGTPQYMAPEQREQPETVDHRVDIYALGVVFYQMLTGELPGGKIEPPSAKVRIDVRLDEVVLRALERKPELRYQQASVLKTQVETIAQTPADANRRAEAQTGSTAARAGGWRIIVGIAIGVAAATMIIAFLGLLAAVAIPNFVKARQRSQQLAAQQWTEQGWQLWQAGKLAEAGAKFQQAVQLAPGDANAWNGLGWAQFNSGDRAAAETTFRKALAIETNQPGALNGLGQIYLSERKYDDAEQYLLRAAPQAPAAWYGLARLYLQEEKFDQAEKWAQDIVDSGQADEATRKLLETAKAKRQSEGLPRAVEPSASSSTNYPGDWIWAADSKNLDRVPPIFLLRPSTLAAGQEPFEIYGKDRYLARGRTLQQLLTSLWSQKDSARKIFFADDLSTNQYDFIAAAQPRWWDRLESEINQRFDLQEETKTDQRNGTVMTVIRRASGSGTGAGGTGAPVFSVAAPGAAPLSYQWNLDPATGLPASAGAASRATNGEPAAVAEAWAPASDERTNLQEILKEANGLMNQGHYEDSLQRHLWYFNHEKEFGDAYQNVVRITSALSDWVELGRRYPPAKEALVGIRDRDTRQLAEGKGYSNLFADTAAINGALRDEDATYALFKTIRQKDPQLAGQCYFEIEGLLAAKGEYQFCYDHMGDPQSRFDNLRRGYAMQVANQKRMAEAQQRSRQSIEEMNRKNGWTNAPAYFSHDISAQMNKNSADFFTGQVRQLIEILVATSHQADAEKIRDQALAVLDDDRLRSAISDAEEKIHKRSAAANNGF